MSKTIIYPEFIEKELKRLRIKTRFTKNMKKSRTSLDGISKQNTFKDVISMAFVWRYSLEGEEYWLKLYNSL